MRDGEKRTQKECALKASVIGKKEGRGNEETTADFYDVSRADEDDKLL